MRNQASSPKPALVEDQREAYFPDSMAHLLAELKRVDLLIQSQVRRARERQRVDEQFQGLYISEHEVDDLFSNPADLPFWALRESDASTEHLTGGLNEIQEANARRACASSARGIRLRLPNLIEVFSLDDFERDVLLIGLAPEIDSRYERFFGYLQDDVTKKRPSIDLILNLLCGSFGEKVHSRRYFEAFGRLFENLLVQAFDDPSQPHPTMLGRYLRADERVVQYLLGSDVPDAKLSRVARCAVSNVSPEDLVLEDAEKQRVMRLASYVRQHPAILYLHGPYGAGKHTSASAIAGIAGKRLLTVDGAQLAAVDAATAESQLRLALREAALQGSALCWNGFDALLGDEHAPLRNLLLKSLEERAELAFLIGTGVWEPVDRFRSLPFLRLEFQYPGYPERRGLWAKAMGGVDAEALDLAAVANKFRFTGGQIEDAAATARHLALRRDPQRALVMMKDLYEAARLQSSFKLSTLAKKIIPRYDWNDIVLPGDRIQQLREICNCMKYRSLVYEEWGFDKKLSLGKGLNVLFAGPPGTGKTMAAEIVARELALDLYKIDLSTVVSKYIGETEKNLSKIFNEAENCNAILFFDEADALFGKRSEVRDSHDRYANIETGYLLQRMEEYEGVVILATNFRKNMDEAFVRRLHVAIEFPFPGVRERLQIWNGVWPSATPRATDCDLPFMAQQYELTGGSIRNIALGAAFLAADNGGKLHMNHLLQATRREYQKMGKVLTGGEFAPTPTASPKGDPNV